MMSVSTVVYPSAGIKAIKKDFLLGKNNNDCLRKLNVLLIFRVFSPNRFMAIFLGSVDPVCSSIQTRKWPWVFIFKFISRSYYL